MARPADPRSVLIVTADASVAEAIGSAVSTIPNVRVDREVSTLAGLNGTATTLVAQHDLVLFQALPDDAREIGAIRKLSAARQGNTVFVALADETISFGQLRSLTEAGVDEVLPMPGPGADLGAALDRMRSRLAPAGRPPGWVIPVLRARGGIGATTLAVNLADRLAGLRRRRQPAPRVALADLDLQYGTVASMLDLEPQNALLDLAQRAVLPDAQFLETAMRTLSSGLSVLTAPARLGPLDLLRPDQVEALLGLMRARADYVVVDLPHAMVPWVEPVLQQSAAVLLVTDTTVPAIHHCRRQIDFLTADHADLPIRIVVNHERRPLFPRATVRESARALERPLDIWLPNDSRAARAAADAGTPLSRAARLSPLTRAIDRLARGLAAEFPVSVTASATAR